MRSVLFILAITTALFAKGQANDFILLKKKDRTIRSYYPGMNIEFITTGGAYRNALITAIRHDSIFLQEFLVRQVPTTLGFSIADTAGSFRFSYHYTQIGKIGKDNKKFNVSGSGAALLGGGIVLTLASGIVYLADREKFSPALMGTSAGLAGLGYLMSRSGGKGIVIGKNHYRLQYMPVNSK